MARGDAARGARGDRHGANAEGLTPRKGLSMVRASPMNRKRSAAPPPRRRTPGLLVRQGQYRVIDDVARRIYAGHPWVYRDALQGRAVAEPTGTLVELIAGNREFLARGYV